MYKYTVEILSPSDHDGWADDVVFDDEKNAVKLGLEKGEIYSCGWTDSSNEDNDEAVYKMVDVLFEKAKPKPNSMHPQTFDPNSVVTYKKHKYFCTAGPALFASKGALELLAKDAGVLVGSYDPGKTPPGTGGAFGEDCTFCDKDAVITFYNKEGHDDIHYCIRHLPQVVTAAVNTIKYEREE